MSLHPLSDSIKYLGTHTKYDAEPMSSVVPLLF